MWLQKKDVCPICRKKIDKIIPIYFPELKNNNNSKLNYLYYNIENLKLDNYGHTSEKCLICGKDEPKEQLLICNFCNYFQSHVFCDPPAGLVYGKYFCAFCRKKFVEALKNK